jgi:hypothetical protein
MCTSNPEHIFEIREFLFSDGWFFRRQKVVPTAVATGLDIGLSNLSLRAITLSFYSKPSLGVPPGDLLT